jgi:hypothetical protein
MRNAALELGHRTVLYGFEKFWTVQNDIVLKSDQSICDCRNFLFRSYFMKNGLRAWQFLGITLSLVWAALGAGYWTAKVNENAWAHAEDTFLDCRERQPRNSSFDACLQNMQDEYDAYADPQPRWEPFVERALLPPASGWLGAYVMAAMSRQLKRRRSAKQ